jgi:hypothetical protein
MTCCLTLSSTDVAAGRIAARHRARIAHLRAGSCAVAGAHADGFASCYFSCYSCEALKNRKTPAESVV